MTRKNAVTRYYRVLRCGGFRPFAPPVALTSWKQAALDAHRESHAADHAAPARSAPELAVPQSQTISSASVGRSRLLAGPPSPPQVRAEAAIGLQRVVGNRTVRRLLARIPASENTASVLAKTFGTNEDELALLGKTVVATPGAALAPAARPIQRAAVTVQATAPVRAPLDRIDDQAVDGEAVGLLAKAGTDIRAGAPPSKTMGPKTAGFTYPERVDVNIGAWFESSNKTWRPIVKFLTGHFSLQARLIPGQVEITGPGGNTTQTNYCSQCENLKELGNTLTNSWYVLAAVQSHENIHATRFYPALNDAEPAITAEIEAVTIPDEQDMTESQAVAKLKAAPAFLAAVAHAQELWLAKIKIRVAQDHATGGATEAAERMVTEPLRTTICDHAAKEDWPECESCPPRPKKSIWDRVF